MSIPNRRELKAARAGSASLSLLTFHRNQKQENKNHDNKKNAERAPNATGGQYFLITVTDCCDEPELTGPFTSKRERDEQGAAIEPTLEDNDKNYLLKLDIEFGKVSVSLIPIE